MEKMYCVYILTNDRHTVLYTGVTSDLPARLFQHRNKLLPEFTKRYNVSKLVYFECGSDALGAIAREKQIKAGSRQKKIELINALNPEWRTCTTTSSQSPKLSLRAKRSNLRRQSLYRSRLLRRCAPRNDSSCREEKMSKLAGKVALITGAAGGQGTADAELFVKEGAAVVLTDVDAEKGEALAKRIAEAGGKALFRVQDVSDEISWKDIIAATLRELGGLHILVNNAGTIARQGIVNTTLEAWNRTMAVNLTGPLLGMKHCAPAIRDSGGGSIINISSTAGLTAHDDAAYTASKWGLRGLTKTAVLQFAAWNIRVNSIHPGQIAETGFFDNAGPAFAHAARAAIPLHRQGLPRECAELVLFLASEESSFVNGAEIAIDGGYIAAGLANMRNLVRSQFTGANS